MTPERLLIFLLAALVIALTRWMGKLEDRNSALADVNSSLWSLWETTKTTDDEDEDDEDDDDDEDEDHDLHQDYGLAS